MLASRLLGAVLKPSGAGRPTVRSIWPPLCDPWRSQKRYMGGARKSMAKARQLLVKKQAKARRLEEIRRRPRNPVLDETLRCATRTRMMWNIKCVLATAEGRVMPSTQVTRLVKALGFPKGVSFTKFISKYPAVFKYSRDNVHRTVAWLEFTEEAEDLVEEEERIMREYQEPLLVELLRKLLMMATGHRISLMKLTQVKSTFMLPDNFRRDLLPKYPQFFKVEDNELVLVKFDPALAVTAREKGRANAFDSRADAYSFFITMGSAPPMNRNIAARLAHFQKLPFPSPYEDSDGLDHRSLESQKRIVAVCHEFLSLSVEKKAPIWHLALFGKEFMLCDKLEHFLVRYPHIFYVSQKGDRHVVFLHEAYRGRRLKQIHPLTQIKKKFEKLMQIQPSRSSRELLERLPGGTTERLLKSLSNPGPNDERFPYHEADLVKGRWSFPFEDEESGDDEFRAPTEPVMQSKANLSFPHKADGSSDLQHQRQQQAQPRWSSPFVPGDNSSLVPATEPKDRNAMPWGQLDDHKQQFAYQRYKVDDGDSEDEHDSELAYANLAKKLGIHDDDEEIEVEDSPKERDEDHEQQAEEEEFIPKRHKRFKNAWKNKIHNDELLAMRQRREKHG